MDPVDHRVDRDCAHGPRCDDRGVVADAAQQARALRRAGAGFAARRFLPRRACQLGRDGFDQGALGDACAQRCR
jgi:hypothetical protein